MILPTTIRFALPGNLEWKYCSNLTNVPYLGLVVYQLQVISCISCQSFAEFHNQFLS